MVENEYKDGEKVLYKTKCKLTLPDKEPEEAECFVGEAHLFIDAKEAVKFPIWRIRSSVSHRAPSSVAYSYSHAVPEEPAGDTVSLTFLDYQKKKHEMVLEIPFESSSLEFKMALDRPDIYKPTFDLSNLTDEERKEFSKHEFSSTYSAGLVVFLHIITMGLFTLIYFGLKHSKLPLIKHDDFKAGKAIGFMFIPYFNLYWVFKFWFRLMDRVNFQMRLRGEEEAISRNLMLWTIIIGFIVAGFASLATYAGFAALVMYTICVYKIQVATNKLTELSTYEKYSKTPTS